MCVFVMYREPRGEEALYTGSYAWKVIAIFEKGFLRTKKISKIRKRIFKDKKDFEDTIKDF